MKKEICISEFLEPFFKEMKDMPYLWCVARGWEGLPEYTRHDVDIYLEEAGYNYLKKILYSTAKKTGWSVFRECKKSIYRPFLMLKIGADGNFKFIQLDIFLGAILKGVPARTNFVDMLKLRWLNDKGIWCCNLGYMGARVLLKELVQNSTLGSKKRQQQIFDAANSDNKNFRDFLLAELVNELLVGRIMNLVTSKDWQSLDSLADEIRRNMPRITPVNFVKTVAWSIASIRVRCRPFFRFFVAIVGPDGCGKTTVAERLEKYMDCNPFSLTYRIHSNFGFVPRLRNVYATVMRMLGRTIEFKPDPEPGTKYMGMQRPLKAFRAFIYVTYYGIGLALSRAKIFRMYPYFSMILADRYYYDYYYMRGYIKCPNWYKKIIEIFVPKPDLILFLNRDAARIFLQKPELSIDEIKRQQDVIRSVMCGHEEFYEINGNDGIETTIDNVIRAVANRLNKILENK